MDVNHPLCPLRLRLFFIFIFLMGASVFAFSQEFTKNAIVHFKDKSTAEGDVFYYPILSQSIELRDSLNKKTVYQISTIDFIKSKTAVLRVIEFDGQLKLFDCLLDGPKISLYQTNLNDTTELYVYKSSQMYLLNGKKIYVNNDGDRYSRMDQRYKGTLKFLMSDNESVVKNIDDLPFHKDEIKETLIAYNGGIISFLKPDQAEKIEKHAVWSVYTQYSHVVEGPNFMGEAPKATLYQAGARVRFSENSRHSFKFGYEFGDYYNVFSEKREKYENISAYYAYDFAKLPKARFYFGMRLLDFGKYSEANITYWIFLYPRIRPDLGYELNITRHLNLFIELDNFLNLNRVPANFSTGFIFDL